MCVCVHKFAGTSALCPCAQNPWIANREEGAGAHCMCTKCYTCNVGVGGGSVLYISPGCSLVTIAVQVHYLSNSCNSIHTECETTPIHLCLHHLRRNTLQYLTLLSGMAPCWTTNCIVRPLHSKMYPDWAQGVCVVWEGSRAISTSAKSTLQIWLLVFVLPSLMRLNRRGKCIGEG